MPTRKTIQGLWAELLLLRVSNDPHALVAAWHAVPHERFDFASGPQRLEVKSNSSRRREHHFTLEQVTRGGKTTVVIASVFVERSGGGLSLRQLFENSRAQVSNNPALLSRIDAVFYSSLGSGWADAMDEAFDWELATGCSPSTRRRPCPSQTTRHHDSSATFGSGLILGLQRFS